MQNPHKNADIKPNTQQQSKQLQTNSYINLMINEGTITSPKLGGTVQLHQ